MVLLTPTYDLGWWVRTMFSSPLEVHAFELGVLAGIVVAALLVWGFQKSAVLVSIALLFFRTRCD